MVKQSASTRKRKHVFTEGGFDSDSNEELDVDIGITVDNQGYATKSYHLHRQPTSSTSKTSDTTPGLDSNLPHLSPNNTKPADAPDAPIPMEEKRKRKQVRIYIPLS